MAWIFDGVNDYVTLGDDAALDFPEAGWALGFWIKQTDFSGSSVQYVCSWLSATTGTNPSFNVQVGEASFGGGLNNDIGVFASDGDTDDNIANTGSSNLFDSNTAWTHLLVQNEGSGLIRWYLNGALAGQHNTATLGAISGTGTFAIGASITPSLYLDAELCEMAKWNRSLNSTEMAGLTFGYSPLFYREDLQWYLPMHAGIYEEKIQGLTVTNNGSSTATHPTNIINPYDSLLLLGVGRT